jgi:quercetin dioxygenase-like cupin family protein
MQIIQGPIVVRPLAGKTVTFGGMPLTIKIVGDQTGGAFTILENSIQAGVLVPPHRHTREDELSYVAEGQIGFKFGDQELTLGPGTYVFKPRHVPHAFWNAGPQPGRVLEIVSPAGLEHYFAELSELLNGSGPPDHAKIGALRERYGVLGVPEWVPDLKARYNIKVFGRD